jgi:phage repressor protein C with HTH and peptisase S24 domain/DNA-binding phage protein
MKATTVEDAKFRARLSQVLKSFTSVAALAREIGISDNAIYKWLAGRGQPSISNLVSLSRTAGVSLDWLATGREPTECGTPALGREATEWGTPALGREPTDRGTPATDRKPGERRTPVAGLEPAGHRRAMPSRVAADARDGGPRRTAADADRSSDARDAGPRRGGSGASAPASSTADGHRRATAGERAGSSLRGLPEDDALRQAPTRVAYDEYTFVPREQARVFDGKATMIRSQQVVDSLAFKTEWVRRRLLAAPRNLMLVEVVGDSMAPTLVDSDLILVDLGEPRFKQDGVYVLRRDTELVVKRLQRRPDGKLIIRSDNPAYESTILSRETLGIIGRVIWGAGRM